MSTPTSDLLARARTYIVSDADANHAQTEKFTAEDGVAVLAYTNSSVLPHLRRAVEESEGATVPMSSLYWAALLLTNQKPPDSASPPDNASLKKLPFAELATAITRHDIGSCRRSQKCYLLRRSCPSTRPPSSATSPR